MREHSHSIDADGRRAVPETPLSAKAEPGVRTQAGWIRELAENIREVLWLTDWSKREVLYVSSAYEEVWGRTCRSLYENPRSWADTIHPQDRDRVVEAFETGCALGAFDVEYRLLRDDGSERWIHDRAFPVLDANGVVLRVAGISEDVTRRKRAELALRESEELRRCLTENSADYILFVDLGGTIRYINRTLPEYTVEQVIGTSLFAYLRGDSQTAARLALERAQRSGRPDRFEMAFHERPHETLFFEVRIAPVLRDRAVDAFVINASDITERKRTEEALRLAHQELERRVDERTSELACAYEALQRSEEIFRQLAEHIREVFWVADHVEGRMIYVSPAYEEIWGRTREGLYDDIRSYLEAVHPEDRPRVASALKRKIRGEPTTEEYRVVRPDGSVRWIWDRAFPVRDAMGRVVRAVGIAEDITDWKNAAQREREHQSELDHVSRLSVIGQMAASIAHEINQPLSAIINRAAAIRHGLSCEPIDCATLDTHVAEIIEQGLRAGEIIKQVRNHTRRGETKPIIADLRAVVSEAVRLAMPDARFHGITLETDIPDVPYSVQVVSIAIQQVILNLVRNAIESIDDARAAERRVTISLRAGVGVVECGVIDTGPGIRPEHHHCVFDTFYTTKPRGTGLGLAISRSIIEAHGGHLIAEPNRTQGAAMWFSLPQRVKE